MTSKHEENIKVTSAVGWKRIFRDAFTNSKKPSKRPKLQKDITKKTRARPKTVQSLKIISIGKQVVVKDEGLNLDFLPNFYSHAESSRIFDELERVVEYNKPDDSAIVLFGKKHLIPRLQVAYGDPGLTYTFSGATIRPQPWVPIVEKLRDDVSKHCGFKFNYALVNRYKDGNDRIGPHQDDEKCLSGKCIAGLTFGAERDFVFKHHKVHKPNAVAMTGKPKYGRVVVPLSAGSLILINPPTNKYWYHELPIRKRVKNPRISITFRDMIPNPQVRSIK
jgi:alpha-ketoglutarate-dependent dioxygenase alkB family protein 2